MAEAATQIMDRARAEYWVQHLEEIGYFANIVDQGEAGWAVWCDQAKLAFQTENGIRSFLRVRVVLGGSPKEVPNG